MTFKTKVAQLTTDLITGWVATLKRWSVVLNIANIVWSGSAILAMQFGLLPESITLIAFVGSVVLLILSTLAANLTQKNCKTYDPSTQGLYDLETEVVKRKVPHGRSPKQ